MNGDNLNAPESSVMTIGPDTLASDSSRRDFLTKLMAGAAAATAAATVPASVFASTGKMKEVGANIPMSDAAILNFALTLEHLEARFYERAARHFSAGAYVARRTATQFAGGSYLARLVRILRLDELSHVKGLTAALRGAGVTPVAAAPRYNFPAVFNNKNAFLNFAATLEDAGVHAYLGQAGLIKTPSILLTAASILTVEARHTGAIRAMLYRDPTDGPFDHGLTKEQILGIAGPLIGH